MDNLHIPEQHTGAQTNTSHSVTAKDKEEAIKIFKHASKRLLNINSWHKLAGKGSADFQLINAEDKMQSGAARVNDYFKIDLPAPGSSAGEGYDWVRVEKIEDNSDEKAGEESILMEVRPCSPPDESKNETAHFFSEEATSTFVIRRQNNTITASVHGRNEKPNTGMDSVTDTVRNTLVGIGAMAGASKIQWKSLVNGLLKDA